MKRLVIKANKGTPLRFGKEQRPNDKCKCGSEKKAKKCCLAKQKAQIQAKVKQMNER